MAGTETATGTPWAVILGASSGFGAATSRELAAAGFNICGVHLDRRSTMPLAEAVIADVQAAGREAAFFNVNAADPEKRAEVIQALKERGARVRVLMHSLAFGTLRRYIEPDPAQQLTQKQLEMTLDVMANSLVYWTQDLFHAGLFDQDARIFAMTSEGSTRVWAGYGAVSAAKAALEAHIRQLAVELAPHGIAANSIQAGVTPTPAQSKIPGADEMLEGAKARNPGGRVTTPEDVARAIRVLSTPGIGWITGNVIRVDGGEAIVP
ncbi:enoyl-ACP reductase [Sphaerobacter thermophilus]|uniref:Short-chain dehydrogenase/reductase SDR n=1 Tax=Sphaerobacter thermophilus (strain ATCC 49802 / DSM 20745 / KCCM 41009 / NCIMB 13125 / S 6022) TaxID=479434 RepID=D1C2G2_SPHTD|nr:SDR family oxidoreductase [Sphaerobacter thermophilus]ACZ38429.1 short-chain dehydrogenase/reductase SDR [Sphaerobacter thermophilus DSM 20745]